MKKRILAAALSTAILIGAMTGCSSKPSDPGDTSSKGSVSTEGTTTETVTFPLKEPVTMTMFALINGEIELQDTFAMKSMEEQTNVKWEVQSIMGADLAEKRNLILASNEYPDVMFKAGLGQSDLDKFGSQGTFIPLQDLMAKHAPNFSKIMTDKPIVRDVISSADGSIYSFPEVDAQLPAISPYFINQKWMKNLGLEEPKNLDELYKVLKAFKDEDANGNGNPNDEIPYLATTNCKPMQLAAYAGIPLDLGTRSYIENNELVYAPTSPKFKELVAFITKIYSEGLMYKDSFTLPHEQQAAIGSAGDVLGSFIDAGAFLAVGRDNDEDYRILTPFEDGALLATSGTYSGTMAITDKCKTPEIAVAWGDKFYSEEGGQLAWLGVKDKTYKVNADGTWEWILVDDMALGVVRQMAGIQGAANHPSIQPQLWFTGMTDPEEKLLTEERDRMVAMSAGAFPALKYPDADVKIVASIKADVDVYIDEYIAKVATGELQLDASWDEYVKTLEAMRVPEMVKIYQTAYAATK